MAGKRPMRVSYGWLLAAFAVIIAVYMFASNNIATQKKLLIGQEGAQRVALSRLETEQTALSKEIELSGTDAYIENLARTQYGFLKPGEIRFEITNPQALFSNIESADIQVVQNE